MLSSEPDSDLFTFNMTTSGGGGEQSFNRQTQRLNTRRSTSTWAIRELQPTRRLGLLLPGCDAAAILCMQDHACFIIGHLVDAFIHCREYDAGSSYLFFLFTTTPFSALLLTIKNTTLNHKLIVLVAQTFLRGRVALEAEIASLVGVNLRWVETKRRERIRVSCYF